MALKQFQFKTALAAAEQSPAVKGQAQLSAHVSALLKVRAGEADPLRTYIYIVSLPRALQKD
ncbi:MAG: hypothetical protein BCS36_06845 [Desulfovibrio sp. MES5]|nr:MAG: hypothetical protein BCS36_06845 [Desulfovibrio sp. MES5]